MKLATFIAQDGTEHAGEVRGEEVVAFSAGTVLDRLQTGDRTPADGPTHALADVTLLAPVPRPPAIFCIGRNYAAHISEMGSDKPEKDEVFAAATAAFARSVSSTSIYTPETENRQEHRMTTTTSKMWMMRKK